MVSETPIQSNPELPGDASKMVPVPDDSKTITTEEVMNHMKTLTIENAGGKNKEQFTKDLERLDSHYFMKKKEMEAKIVALEKDYFKNFFKTMLDKRSLIIKANEDSVPGFWQQVFMNCNEEWQVIEEWDEEVIKHLMDIKFENISDDKMSFKLTFEFEKNDFFENEKITTTYKAERANQWTEDLEVMKLDCDEIKWKEGKNVIFETVTIKKKKGRKGKPVSTTVQRKRASFFRWFFRMIEPDMELSDEENEDDEDDESDYSDEEEEDATGMRMHEVYDVAVEIRDSVIPHAIRYYTGEAIEEDDAEFEGDSDADSDDSAPALAKDGEQKQEECKQQ